MYVNDEMERGFIAITSLVRSAGFSPAIILLRCIVIVRDKFHFRNMEYSVPKSIDSSSRQQAKVEQTTGNNVHVCQPPSRNGVRPHF